VPEPSILDGGMPYLDGVSVAYDDVSGTVTGTLSLYDPAYWDPRAQGAAIQVDLSTACMDQYDLSGTYPVPVGIYGGSQSGWPRGEYDLTFTLTVNDDVFGSVTSGSLTGYQGSVENTDVSFDGSTYSGAVQSPYFAHRNFRCAFLSVTNATPYNDSYPGWRWLSGYAPPPPPATLPTAISTSSPQVRPYRVLINRWILGGWTGHRHIRKLSNMGRLTWTQWSQTDGRATGALWTLVCRPDCAGGYYDPIRAKVHVWQPNRQGVFTRMRVDAGRYHLNYNAQYSSGYWYWQ
jgi:hypothetical protein